MKRPSHRDLVESREAVRQAAFELARSGVFGCWQDIWHALRGHFSVEQLIRVFENPLSQMDIDQRCHRVKSMSLHVDRDPEEQRSLTRRSESSPVVTWMHSTVDPETRQPPVLAERIQEMLANGRECTAVELAEQLEASRAEVLRALRAMLDAGLLQVTRSVVGVHGGRGARVFACAAELTWPQADPVVAGAIDAIARHR